MLSLQQKRFKEGFRCSVHTWQQKLGPRYVIYRYLLLYTRIRFLSISDFLPAVSVPFDTFCGQCTIHEGVLTRFEDRSKRSSRFCRLLDRLSPDFILKSGRIEIHPNTVPLENSVECIDRRNAKTANLPVH